jgi:hypothetical protein
MDGNLCRRPTGSGPNSLRRRETPPGERQGNTGSAQRRTLGGRSGNASDGCHLGTVPLICGLVRTWRLCSDGQRSRHHQRTLSIGTGHRDGPPTVPRCPVRLRTRVTDAPVQGPRWSRPRLGCCSGGYPCRGLADRMDSPPGHGGRTRWGAIRTVVVGPVVRLTRMAHVGYAQTRRWGGWTPSPRRRGAARGRPTRALTDHPASPPDAGQRRG